MAFENLNLKAGDTDTIGNQVLQVFAKEPDKYIIYETTAHTLVFDGPAAHLSPSVHDLMNRIADLTSHDPSLKKIYNSSIGHAFKVLFDGDARSSEQTLQRVYENMYGHLSRSAKLPYQLGALSVMLIALIAFLLGYWLDMSDQLTIRLFCAVLFSAMGGFLSVVIGSQKLAIDVQQKSRVHIVYGAFRIIVAMISGVVMCFLIDAGILLAFLQAPTALNGFIIASFLAGFSEKLVPNLLMRIETESARAKQSS